jgi:hypothetical protein
MTLSPDESTVQQARAAAWMMSRTRNAVDSTQRAQHAQNAHRRHVADSRQQCEITADDCRRSNRLDVDHKHSDANRLGSPFDSTSLKSRHPCLPAATPREQGICQQQRHAPQTPMPTSFRHISIVKMTAKMISVFTTIRVIVESFGLSGLSMAMKMQLARIASRIPFSNSLQTRNDD